MCGVSGGSGRGRPCSKQVSAVDERDDAAACGGDALFFFDASMAVIEIAFACCVWLRVDEKCCGCGLFDAVVMVAGAAAVCCVG